jgi:hypothetical protein
MSPTKLLVILLILALVVTFMLPWIVTPKLEANFYMVNIPGGVMVEGTVRNSGLGVARNVALHLTFYNYRGDVIRNWTQPLGDLGASAEKHVMLRFKIDASSFTWQLEEKK